MKIALLGYGKMGKAIEQVAENDTETHEIVLRLNSENRSDFLAEDIAEADVAIEFSVPETAVSNIKLALNANIPVVCGTTGWLHEWKEIEHIVQQKKGAFFYASNFSIGVNLYLSICEKLAKMMNEQDDFIPHISETHHTQKLDKPSGTAITIAEVLSENLDGYNNWKLNGPIDSQTIGIESIRKGKVFGDHSVTFESKTDIITLEHSAKSREGFANGALAAAKFIIGRQGVFGMKDLLGI